MKYLIFLPIFFFAFHGHAQLSEQQKHELDSIYKIAIDSSKTLDTRLRAYHRSSRKSAYQDYELGLKITSEYLSFAKSNQNEIRIAQASHYKGYTEMMLGDFDAAFKTYQGGLKVAVKSEDKLQIAKLYGDIGNFKVKMGQNEEAIASHKKCLEVADLEKLTVQRARARINIGEIYEIQGQYKQSLQMFQEALSICIDSKLSGFLSSVYENLGDVNLSIKEYETARKNYKNALQFAKRLSNINREIQSLQKLGILNQELGDLNIALQYYKKGLQIASGNEVPGLEAKLMSNLASVSLKQKNTNEALKYILGSIALFEKHDIKENLDETYLITAQVYKELNQINRSKNYYLKSYNIAKKSKNISALANASNGLALIFENENNPVKSLFFYKEFITYSNQKRNEDEVKDIIKIELSSNYRIKVIADSLVKINEINKLKVVHNKKEASSLLQSYFAYSGIGALSLILLSVLYFFIQKRKSADVLGEKNEIIEQALKDKEILLKEVHHRVKNNMQTVSSLLHLKSINTKDKLVKEALLDSKKRIDSMKLAHQKMYQKGNYEKINIVEYCYDIKALLLDSMETDKDEFIVTGDEFSVQVEQAQAIGFVIHELITNSIKYAWNKTQPKCVQISLTNKNNEIQLVYLDNGKGLESSFNLETTKSFGMKLIHSLVTRQLLGAIELRNTEGFYAKITFKGR
ncbi:tetratricopeptide repeat protein [Winogradskyella sp.]|nr:tetratricopeptide repeat protein [Winogradskyella sp.]MDC1503755.1 tetratricopeptide repeat protein [Winogradskyella sp.]